MSSSNYMLRKVISTATGVVNVGFKDGLVQGFNAYAEGLTYPPYCGSPTVVKIPGMKAVSLDVPEGVNHLALRVDISRLPHDGPDPRSGERNLVLYGRTKFSGGVGEVVRMPSEVDTVSHNIGDITQTWEPLVSEGSALRTLTTLRSVVLMDGRIFLTQNVFREENDPYREQLLVDGLPFMWDYFVIPDNHRAYNRFCSKAPQKGTPEFGLL